MTTTNGRDLLPNFPPGTYQWHGPYHIRYKNSQKRRVVGGHVALLPDGKIKLFNKAGKCVKPISGRSFSVTIDRNELFCTFTAQNDLT